MDELLDRYGLAEFMGIIAPTVDWLSQHEGLPVAEQGDPGVGLGRDALAKRSWRATRRDVAKMLNRHEDTVTGLLPHGLGAALLEPGGRGKEAIFDGRLVYRWHAAQSGLLSELVRRDFIVCAELGLLALHHLPVTTLLQGLEPAATAPASRRRRAPKSKA
jgi:phage terminase Nu1 subunit (DNA packaging protein)